MSNMNKRVLVVGANGLLGQKLVQNLKSDYELLAVDLHPSLKQVGIADPDYMQLDITEYNKVREVFQSFRPGYVINAAAYTNVDGCEDEQIISWKVNVVGPKYLAELCRRFDCHLTHMSSDYIFDGKNGPYREDDSPNPLSTYGKQKLNSEQEVQATGCRHTIFRGIVIFGFGVDINLNFATWLRRELSNGHEVRIVTDQWGNTAIADDVARGIAAGLKRDAQGIFNIGNEHFHSRYDFTLEFAKYFNYDKKLIMPILTKVLKQKAVRPLRSGLLVDKIKKELGFTPLDLEESFEMFKNQADNG